MIKRNTVLAALVILITLAYAGVFLLNSRHEKHLNSDYITKACKEVDALKQVIPHGQSEHSLTSFDEIYLEWGEMGEMENYYKKVSIKGNGNINYLSKKGMDRGEDLEDEWKKGRLHEDKTEDALKALNEANFFFIQQGKFGTCYDCNFARFKITANGLSHELSYTGTSHCSTIPNELTTLETSITKIADEWAATQP